MRTQWLICCRAKASKRLNVIGWVFADESLAVVHPIQGITLGNQRRGSRLQNHLIWHVAKPLCLKPTPCPTKPPGMSQESRAVKTGQDDERCFRRARVSLHLERKNLVFTIRCIGENRQNVLLGQLGEVFQYFLLRHAAREHGQHVVHRDAQPSDARPTTAFARLQGNPIHVRSVCVVENHFGSKPLFALWSLR